MLERLVQVDPNDLILYQGACRLAGLSLEQITTPLNKVGPSEFRVHGSETNMALFDPALSTVKNMPRTNFVDELHIALGNVTPADKLHFQQSLTNFLS